MSSQTATHSAPGHRVGHYIGVYRHRGVMGGWESSIYVSDLAVLPRKTQVYLGTSETREEAAIIYDIASYKLSGKVVNSPMRLVLPHLAPFAGMSFAQTVQAIRTESSRGCRARRVLETKKCALVHAPRRRLSTQGSQLQSAHGRDPELARLAFKPYISVRARALAVCTCASIGRRGSWLRRRMLLRFE
jgi:hypothetical protein